MPLLFPFTRLRRILPGAGRSPKGLLSLRRAGILLVVLVTGWLLHETAHVLFLGNTHTVIEGRVYRSGQLSPEALRKYVQANHIRTILDLRGCSPWMSWYVDECRVTQDVNLSQEDITLSANRFPPPAELRRLIEVLDHTEYPILIHCRQGSDRTGLVATMALLLHSDADLKTATAQCSVRFAHFRVLSTARMDEFFDMYADWLGDREHRPDLFRHWVLNDYIPGNGLAELSIADVPAAVKIGEPISLILRARNLSQTAWELKPGTFAGVHARWLLSSISGEVVSSGKSGQREGLVSPGSVEDFQLAIPPIKTAGKYVLQTEMIAEKHIAFSQLGSEPLVLVLEVR